MTPRGNEVDPEVYCRKAIESALAPKFLLVVDKSSVTQSVFSHCKSLNF